ncbi:hypothetical protein DFH09DRAFT_1420203 [Mycena vulgaris]|nr:hypothetical protein DFH09DRAFT_1420203 [Mycena vulgaris]
MDIIFSQLLTIAPVSLIPFIPDGLLRNITLGLAVFGCAAYFLCQNSPSCRVCRLEGSMKEIDELFSSAVEECSRDPHFMAEGGLRLAGVRYRISIIRTKRLNTKHIPWRNYVFYLQDLIQSIRECRGELKDLRSSISLLPLQIQDQTRAEVLTTRTPSITYNPGQHAWIETTRMRRDAARAKMPANLRLAMYALDRRRPKIRHLIYVRAFSAAVSSRASPRVSSPSASQEKKIQAGRLQEITTKCPMPYFQRRLD